MIQNKKYKILNKYNKIIKIIKKHKYLLRKFDKVMQKHVHGVTLHGSF